MSESTATLRERLALEVPELRPIAENVLAAVYRVDLVALDDSGVAHTILEAGEGEDPAMLTHAVAASAWLSARLADWAQLAPDAGIDAAAPARAMLVAADFHPDTVAMAEVLGADRLRLVRLAPATRQALPPAEAAQPAPDTSASQARSGPQMVRPEQPEATESARTSRFRTRLDPTDLGFAAP
ncbi:MAG: hypothetical protein VX246_00210 [Myxococcota bacterium]|nr:hypothetical protein [Myxococcota bacterium]